MLFLQVMGKTLGESSKINKRTTFLICFEIYLESIYQSAVKIRTMYVVGQKPEGKGMADWVNEASDLFDGYLKTYSNSFNGGSEVEA